MHARHINIFLEMILIAILPARTFVGDMLTKDTDAQEMTNMMVGHAVTLNIERPEPVDPKPRIEVKGLTVRSMDGILKLDDVSFTAYSGEILGIAGISGCGQKELLEAIAGLQPTESGSISYINDDGEWALHSRSCPRTGSAWVLSATWIFRRT